LFGLINNLFSACVAQVTESVSNHYDIMRDL
jgi:hypothetical protein